MSESHKEGSVRESFCIFFAWVLGSELEDLKIPLQVTHPTGPCLSELLKTYMKVCTLLSDEMQIKGEKGEAWCSW